MKKGSYDFYSDKIDDFFVPVQFNLPPKFISKCYYNTL